jgi:hypothetical protein
MSRHSTSWRPVLILSTHLHVVIPSGHFHSGFRTRTLYGPLLSPVHAICPAHSVALFYHQKNIWRGVKIISCCSLLSSVLCLLYYKIILTLWYKTVHQKYVLLSKVCSLSVSFVFVNPCWHFLYRAVTCSRSISLAFLLQKCLQWRVLVRLYIISLDVPLLSQVHQSTAFALLHVNHFARSVAAFGFSFCSWSLSFRSRCSSLRNCCSCSDVC